MHNLSYHSIYLKIQTAKSNSLHPTLLAVNIPSAGSM